MQKKLIPLFFSAIFSLATFAMPGQDQQQYPTGPAGFEDPALLGKVMDGDIVIVDKIDTKTELRTVSKAFFVKVAPEAYASLATNHPKYADLFSQVKKGETLKVSDDKTEYDYKLHLVIKVGFITQDVYPEGHQKLFMSTDATKESRIENAFTNYKDKIKSAEQVTRLIPYEGGILVEDDVHLVLQKAGTEATVIKKKLKEFFTNYVSTFREELQGNY